MTPDAATPSLPSPASKRRMALVAYAVSALFSTAAAGILLHTYGQASRYENVHVVGPGDSIKDEADRAARLHDAIGTFVTGKEPGDRTIIIDANHIRFQPVGPLMNSLAYVDTFQLARRGNFTCLFTANSGAVSVVDIDHLTFCGDTYERVK